MTTCNCALGGYGKNPNPKYHSPSCAIEIEARNKLDEYVAREFEKEKNRNREK
jgi:hypothetical protein